MDRFDWLKINPTESYADFAWERLPKGITQAMVESLVDSPNISDEYITSEDPLTLFYVKDQLLAIQVPLPNKKMGMAVESRRGTLV